MIRLATEADIPMLVQLGSRSLLDGPYKGEIRDNPEAHAKLALDVIREKGHVLVIEYEGKVVGLMGFIIFPHYFSGDITGGELMWYCLPEYRKLCGLDTIMLVRRAERMCREAGAKWMQLSAPTQEVAGAYESMKYKPMEMTYRKELVCQ